MTGDKIFEWEKYLIIFLHDFFLFHLTAITHGKLAWVLIDVIPILFLFVVLRESRVRQRALTVITLDGWRQLFCLMTICHGRWCRCPIAFFPLRSSLLTETITGSDLRISLIEQNLINIDTHEILQSDASPDPDWSKLFHSGFSWAIIFLYLSSRTMG